MIGNKVTRRNRALARTATEAKRYAATRKILRALLICLVTLTALVYIVSVLYSKYGSFTVSVNKYDSTKYSLSLSESVQFDSQISRLNSKAATDITNISVRDLPADLDTVTGGEHNGENYMAYTFYLKNVGDDTVTYEYYLYITNVTNNVDTAARIRVYRDGEDVTYARSRSDGGGAEADTTEFLTSRVITRTQVADFRPGDVTRFTVVIWIEGDDADCVDELIGGSLKTDMIISVVESDGGNTP